MDDITPPLSKTNSPLLRSCSPSPSVTPSLALGACPPLDRSFSTASSTSTLSSSRSVSSASDSSTGVNRRRGYMRPQGTAFADSARNRDSVMSLGSIAHMQYYFARTGLLDGKGAQLAKQSKKLGDEGQTIDDMQDQDVVVLTEMESIDQNDPWDAMLPPTVSTYKEKPIHSHPPPDISVLRRELREALDDASKVLQETSNTVPPTSTDEEQSPSTDNQGWFELQGLHVLDVVTLAIRAARDYYTCHSNPQKLYAIKKERDIRSELYQVMDVLKRMANRSFRGGIRTAEQHDIEEWVDRIHTLLSREADQEYQEQALREQYVWLQGEWEGREREREWLFLKAFDPEDEPLPEWTESSANEPSPFLQTLRSGIRLVRLHNALVKQSLRRFGGISVYHTDLNKPYRIADNLRYWMKAAELRWETKLTLNVMDVAYGKGEETWAQFNHAVLKWSAAVREELTSEWLTPQQAPVVLPQVQIGTDPS